MAPKGLTVAMCPGTVSAEGATEAKVSAAQEGVEAEGVACPPPTFNVALRSRVGRTRIRCCLCHKLAGCSETAPLLWAVFPSNTAGCWISSAVVSKPFAMEYVTGSEDTGPGFRGPLGTKGWNFSLSEPVSLCK